MDFCQFSLSSSGFGKRAKQYNMNNEKCLYWFVNLPEMYSELSQTSKLELPSKIVNGHLLSSQKAPT